MPTFVDVVQEVNTSIGAKRVFGEPFEKNGVTIIPAARIMGGVGGGEGEPRTTDGSAKGVKPTGIAGGFGISGAPAGAYVIRGDRVLWLPAIDVNRLMLGFQIVAVFFLLTLRTIVTTRANSAPRGATRPA